MIGGGGKLDFNKACTLYCTGQHWCVSLCEYDSGQNAGREVVEHCGRTVPPGVGASAHLRKEEKGTPRTKENEMHCHVLCVALYIQ